MGATFDFMPMLGLYARAGILVNNDIVLIDRIDLERGERSGEDFESVIAASVRLHSTVMAMATTVIGLLPLILSGDPLSYGVASLIAFDLVVGTVLTLGVVPVLYTLCFRIPTHD